MRQAFSQLFFHGRGSIVVYADYTELGRCGGICQAFSQGYAHGRWQTSRYRDYTRLDQSGGIRQVFCQFYFSGHFRVGKVGIMAKVTIQLRMTE
jgi:hypothetical protein